MGLVGLFACVDLFHGTDFETLCERNPAACAGSANDAGKPLLDFCAWPSATAREKAVRACAWLGACEGPLGETAFGRCLVRALSAFDCTFNPALRPRGDAHTLWSCLAQVESCKDVDACVFTGTPPECAAVQAGSFTACSATARVECARPDGGRAAGVEPCALEGRTCTKLDDSRALCTGVGGAACSAGASCAGTSAIDCGPFGGTLVDRGRDCAAVGGGSCVAGGDAGVACTPIPTAPSCTGGLDVRCEGTTVTSCVQGKRVSFDCRVLGAPCDVTQPIPPTDPALACADRTSPSRCTGPDECVAGKIESCANGVKVTADCASVGLGPCVKGANDLAACEARP
jgi:hypothetical protein